MILVVGASGELGRRICRHLLAMHYDVRAMSRDAVRLSALADDGVHVACGDLRDDGSLRAAVDGCDCVIHCATGRPARQDRANTYLTVDDKGTAALVAAAVDSGVTRLVYVSSLGASPDSPLESLRMKYRAEWHVLHSGLHFTIVRPGAFAETWLGPLAVRACRTGTATIPGAVHALSFVCADDVARLCALALSDPNLEDRTIDVGGPLPITFEQAVAAIERGVGRKVRRIRVPAEFLRMAAIAASAIDPARAERFAFAHYVSTRPHACDSSGLQRMVPGWSPVSVEDAVEQLARSS